MIVTIISSFADDVIIDGEKKIIKKGGPAKFIENALIKLNLDYKIITGKRGKVEIEMEKEIGKILLSEKIDFKPEPQPEFVIISTLKDEYPLKAEGRFNCLDIQGYVRRYDFSKKMFSSKELKKFDIIKGTEEELSYLSKKDLSKKSIILETKGKEGCVIRKDNQKIIIKPKIVDSPDTIGAGDTFFAVFCITYYQTRDLELSGRTAAKEVGKFLKGKTKGVKNDKQLGGAKNEKN